MNKKSTKLFLLISLSIILLFGQVLLVGAKKSDAPLAQATPTENTIGINETEVPFKLIQEEDITLSGPYGATYFSFDIPNTWSISSGAELHLDMTVDFNQIFSNEFGYPLVSGGGNLIVYLNNTLLGVLNLDETGNIKQTLPVPLEAFVSNREDGQMAFYAELHANDFCYVDEDFNLFIHSTSSFSIPHEIAAPTPDLTNIQKLLYENTFVQQSALIVLPDQPSVAELQAALTVAGAMGNISQNNLPIDATTISALTPEQMALNHLLLVGKASQLSILGGLNLPAPRSGNGFNLTGAGADAGVIQMINSPWDISRMIVLVSGNSDEGVVKAAQALSTGVLRPHNANNISVVDEIKPAEEAPSLISTAETRTLENMGYKNDVFQYKGFNATAYTFQIPLGWTVQDDAYFELAYGFSSMIDYEQSGINIFLNGNPIGSVNLDTETAKNSINTVKIDIPKNSVIPGENTLEIQAYMYPNDVCTPPDALGMWINIWKESVLSTPLVEDQTELSATLDLVEYPAPFDFNLELNNTAFVLPKGDLEAWRGAVKMASYLGYQTNPSIITLSTFFADDFPESERPNYHTIIVGRPSQMPVVDELGEFLPVPFEAGSDTALEGNLRVIFNIPENAPLGYIELLASPWNPENVILAVLGNSAQGETWAATALNDSTLRSELSGNLVIVNDRQVLASDTRAFPISEQAAGAGEAPEINVLSTQEAMPQNDTLDQSQRWIPIAIFIGIGLIALIIIIKVRSMLKRSSERKNNAGE